MPRVFYECDGNVAECWRELAANACALYLLIVSVACLKSAGLECLLDDEWNVFGVECTLLRVVDVASTDV